MAQRYRTGSEGGAGRRISSTAVFLGDGLYADYDGYQISLFAHNGYCETDTVYLEPRVLAAFEEYVKGLRQSALVQVADIEKRISVLDNEMSDLFEKRDKILKPVQCGMVDHVGDPANNDVAGLRIVEVEDGK